MKILFVLFIIAIVALPLHGAEQEGWPAVNSVTNRADAIEVAKKLVTRLKTEPSTEGNIMLSRFQSHWKIHPLDLGMTTAEIIELSATCNRRASKEDAAFAEEAIRLFATKLTK